MTKNLTTVKTISDNCIMLDINNVKIVMNFGNVTDDDLETLNTADAILISNHDYKNYNKLLSLQNYEKQIIATIPTSALLKFHLQESICNRFAMECEDKTESINNLIDKITTLKYSQPLELTENLFITAYRGGLTTGNTIWKISKNEESILAFDEINHRRENIVDGLETEILNNVTTCLVRSNDKFGKVSAKDVEQNILKTIKTQKNTIVFTKYTRLLEVCSILNKNKISACVFSSQGQNYLETMRGMVEWAGENVLKDFSDTKQVPFTYDYVTFTSELDKTQNVTIVVDDCESNYYAFMLLDKFKESEDICFLFLHKEKLFNQINERTFSMKIPKLVPFTNEEILYMQKELDDKNKLAEEDRILNEFLLTKEEESDDEIFIQDKETAKKMFWYEYKTDLWIHEGEEKFATFPEPRCQRYDDYGEIFNFKFNPEIKPDATIIKEATCDYELPNNKIEWIVTDFNLQQNIVTVDFDGLCDFNSVKNILEIARPKNLIVYGDKDTAEIYYNYFLFKKTFKDVFLLKDEVNLNVDQVDYEILKVTDDFYEKLSFKQQGTQIIGGFKGKIENSELVYMGVCSNYIICDYRLHDLKRIFVDKGFKVDLSGEILTIEDEVVLEIFEDEISLVGELTDCYQAVRKMLYESMIII